MYTHTKQRFQFRGKTCRTKKPVCENAVTYLGFVHTLPDSFCAGTKIILDRASEHKQER